VEQAHGIARLQVVGEDEHAHRGVEAADFLGGHQPLVGVGGWHLDVDDRHVGAVQLDAAAEFIWGCRLADDLEARLGEQTVEPLSEEHLVVGDHDSHGISARILRRPPGAWRTLSRPSSAPTRSWRSMKSSGASPSRVISTTSRPSRRVAPTVTVLPLLCLTTSATTN
jgi:hypothetical protein